GYPGPPAQPGAYASGGNWAPAKPPRPATPIAGILLIAGSIVMAIATFLPWIGFAGETVNGWDLQDQNGDSSDAGGYIFLAVVLAGFGITTLAAKRVLPIAILAVIFASFAVLAALVDVADASDNPFGVELKVGLWIVLLGAAMTLGGAIWTLAVRRKWPTAVSAE
ncbi:MAG: hypothetical protein M3487_08035, partial [Actinomycetota bacterium]|nr:hypothetical protein [Actinomycetota bacterium]